MVNTSRMSVVKGPGVVAPGDLQLDGWAGRATQDGVPAEAQLGVGFTRRW